MSEKVPDLTALSQKERALVKRAADSYGVSEEEAVTMLTKAGLARRVKKRTGKNPARVYSIKGRK